ncbi:MAG: hydroxymethylbilane synthase [Chlamydiia bacterium]|nr:hydroxymethylbilane synthase [Chlamydiia bacterium]
MMLNVACRHSPLSLAQVKEVFAALPTINYTLFPVTTKGDLDRTTSLRTLPKNDFFTDTVDQLLLEGSCRIAIHSAKDLPDPLPEGLSLIALTQGVDPTDSLVIREGETLASLPKGAVIATSSTRREEAVRQLRSDLTFIDVRGTIHERLDILNQHAHGVVIAEAALIRLNLTHLNRATLPGPTVPFQGQLAIIARSGDTDMQTLFAPLHHG